MSVRAATPVDAGAIEIRRLLSGPNPTLDRAAAQLAAVLPHGLTMHARPHLRLVVEPEVIDAVKHLRSAYRLLWRRIDAVDTNRRDAKRHVLEAIDLLNASLTLLVQSTAARSYARCAALMRDAKARYAHAADTLQLALKELA